MHRDSFERLGKRLWFTYLEDVVHTKVVRRE